MYFFLDFSLDFNVFPQRPGTPVIDLLVLLEVHVFDI